MSNRALKIEQHDASQLAAGYSRSQRHLEIGSIVTFWVLVSTLVWRLVPVAKSQPWLIVAATACGFIMADFVSGFVHWMGDTWGSAEMPILGKALVRPFREHHVDQKAITRHDYIETNGNNCLISIPVALMCVLMPFTIEGLENISIFAATSMGSMIFWVMMTNQFHKWAHLDEAQIPWWLRLLQRMHMVLPPAHHQIHHAAPFDTYYSITTGWLNWPLAKIGFYRRAERLITATFGLIPRRDDIGVDAALAIAPHESKSDVKLSA